jgi:hypothetical protein
MCCRELPDCFGAKNYGSALTEDCCRDVGRGMAATPTMSYGSPGASSHIR